MELIVETLLTIVNLSLFTIKIGEISFIKKYENIFGNEKYKDFASIETMREEIEQTFNEKLLPLDPNNPTFEAR